MGNTTQQDINQTATFSSTLTTLFPTPINTNGVGREVLLLLNNTGGTATNALLLSQQYSPGGTFVPVLSNTDFGTATNVLVETSNGNSAGVSVPQAIPAGSVAFIRFNTGPAVAIQLSASTASGSTTLVITGAVGVYQRAS